MNHIIVGIILLLVSGTGYFFAWKFFKAKKIIFSILLLMFGGFILRLYVASDQYLHPWDERYHAVVAKNMINDPLKPMLYKDPGLPHEYKNWTMSHIWLHKQPFPLWMMALSIKTFGTKEIAVRIPSILLTTMGILIIFLLGKSLYNERVGLISAFLYSINGLLIEITGGRIATDHIDVAFQFFILLAIYFALKFSKTNLIYYNIFCGISIGVAILSKWLPALIVLPIWLIFMHSTKEHKKLGVLLNFLILLAVTSIIFLPWQIYIFKVFPEEAKWESLYNIKHITGSLEGHGQPFYYFFNMIRINYGELIYLPLLWFFYTLIRKWQDPSRWVLAIWFVVPVLFFSFVQTKMQAYILFTAPAIFIISALFWDHLYYYRLRFKYKLLNYSVMFLLLALPYRYMIERVKPFEKGERNPVWASELKNFSREISQQPKTVLFNTSYPVEIMFYTGISAYNHCPSVQTIKELAVKGYKIYLDDNDLPVKLQNLPEVSIIKLSR
ncbi:MAG: ArnT family glycosyltransferase [bacterium]